MIGQHGNLMKIEKWRRHNSIPRFLIIEGQEGSGRLTLAKEIIKTLNATGVIAGNTIAEVRETIQNAYTVYSPTVYIFEDVDDMSVGAKNALLKVVEECPNNAYFIMTIQNLDRMLETIKSRAVLLQVEPYSRKELQCFTDEPKVLEYLTTPELCITADVDELRKCEKLSDEIIEGLYSSKIKGTDILRICTNLKDKDEADKVDCKVFYRVFTRRFSIKFFKHPHILRKYYSLSPKIDREFCNKSINKKASIEAFLMRLFKEVAV